MRRNPASAWVRKDVPELRIISDELWASAKARQIELVKIYKGNMEGSAGPRSARRQRTL